MSRGKKGLLTLEVNSRKTFVALKICVVTHRFSLTDWIFSAISGALFGTNDSVGEEL